MTEQATGGGVSIAARVALLDAIRGFALLGIVVVNAEVFARASGMPASWSWFDEAARWLVAVVFQTKFYLLFSFLFGYSFTIQLDRAAVRGVGFRRRYLRRLMGLAALGGAHAVLLYSGDILVAYAGLGVVLLGVRTLQPGTAVAAACAVLIIVALAFTVVGLRTETTSGAAPRPDRSSSEGRSEATRSPGEVLSRRVQALPMAARYTTLYQAPSALAMFLLGFAAGKRRVLHEPERYPRLWKGFVLAAALVGLPVAVAFTVSDLYGAGRPDLQHLALAADAVGAPVLAAGLLALVVRASGTALAAPALRALAPAGRIALTNYLLQSLLLGLVFTGYGLALRGTVGPAGTLAVALAIFLAQLAGSAWWLRGHRYGPFEWALRWFTELERPRWGKPSHLRVEGMN